MWQQKINSSEQVNLSGGGIIKCISTVAALDADLNFFFTFTAAGRVCVRQLSLYILASSDMIGEWINLKIDLLVYWRELDLL